jgi:hypothetical protein
MFSSRPRLLRVLVLAAAGLLSTAAVGRAALVRVDLSGTATGFASGIGPITNAPYAATVIYDSDASAGAATPDTFPLSSFTDIVFREDPDGSVQVQNDLVIGGADPVDVLTFRAVAFGPLSGGTESDIALELSGDFLPGTRLPTLAELTAGLAGGKLRSVSAGGITVFGTFAPTFDATVDTGSVTASAAAVPEPASATFLAAAGALLLARRSRRRLRA